MKRTFQRSSTIPIPTHPQTPATNSPTYNPSFSFVLNQFKESSLFNKLPQCPSNKCDMPQHAINNMTESTHQFYSIKVTDLFNSSIQKREESKAEQSEDSQEIMAYKRKLSFSSQIMSNSDIIVNTSELIKLLDDSLALPTPLRFPISDDSDYIGYTSCSTLCGKKK